MRNALFLALAYMRFHRVASAALILSIALIAAAPVATRLVLGAAEAALGARAAATPLVLGARGSSLDLTLAALYFRGGVTTPVTHAAVDAVWDSGLAVAIPVHTGFTARALPVVGTVIDYFDFRRLRVAEGRLLGQIGEALLGAEAAVTLGLAVGDTLVTDAQNLFDLAGTYPLELTVAGVLERAGTPDDGAVFVDMKTVWIVAGIGHGHEDISGGATGTTTASPALRQFKRVTPENIDTFHLHQDNSLLPVSAVLIAPHDARSATILQGRYLERDNPVHLIVPTAVIDGLLQTLFRIGRILDAVVVVIGAATAVAIALALSLATQLRQDEMQTFFRLGAHRATIAQAIFAQIMLVILFGAALAATLLAPISLLSDRIASAIVAVTS